MKINLNKNFVKMTLVFCLLSIFLINPAYCKIVMNDFGQTNTNNANTIKTNNAVEKQLYNQIQDNKKEINHLKNDNTDKTKLTNITTEINIIHTDNKQISIKNKKIQSDFIELNKNYTRIDNKITDMSLLMSDLSLIKQQNCKLPNIFVYFTWQTIFTLCIQTAIFLFMVKRMNDFFAIKNKLLLDLHFDYYDEDYKEYTHTKSEKKQQKIKEKLQRRLELLEKIFYTYNHSQKTLNQYVSERKEELNKNKDGKDL